MNRVVVIALLACLLSLLTAPAAAQLPAASPQIILEAVDLGETIRYTASLIKPADLDMQAAFFEISLPPDAQTAAIFETERTDFRGLRRTGEVVSLIWTADALISSEQIDTLTFTLAEELSADMRVYVEYVGATVGAVAIEGKPTPVAAIASSEGELILTPDGTGAELLPVGATGVRVGAAPGLLQEDTRIVARQLPADQNPPPELTTDEGGAFWWCSLVQIDDLPEGIAVPVMVPARRPIAPFTTVRLFQLQADGTWLPLTDTGVVSADGQYIQYVHRGGVIAAGVTPNYQPRPVELIEEAPADLLPGALIGAASALISQPLPANQLDGLPSCLIVTDATTPCQMDDGSVRVCQTGLLNCVFARPDGGICYRPAVPFAIQCRLDASSG